MKKHFFTSYSVFQVVVNSLKRFFRNTDYKPVFIDLGCGPMTSGLALADLIHNETGQGINFSYIGVDIADAMLTRAESFKKNIIFGDDSSFLFVKDWELISSAELNELAGKNNPILFNASYLFASASLKHNDLAKFVEQISKNFDNVFFIFQNPDRADRNTKYKEFKNRLSFTSVINRVERIHYKAASSDSSEEVLFEILKINK